MNGSFDKLYEIVNEAIQLRKSDEYFKTKRIHSELVSNENVREILEIEKPVIENISDVLQLKQGNVYAVRMDKSYGLTGFKKPVIASLVLKRLIESVKRKQYNKKWIDGGNVNSSLALGYFAKKFNGEATYIMSRFFPPFLLDYIREVSENAIRLIKAPDLELGIERDFYQYLLYLIRNKTEFKEYQPLWHAKYSGEYSTFLGNDLADSLKSMNLMPDYIVLVLGAGSTLEGEAIPVKRKYLNLPQIVVPEHYDSPLLSSFNVYNESYQTKSYKQNWFTNPPEGIPHFVIGPHYDEVNPLLKKDVLGQIDLVYRYREQDWKEMSFKCFSSGLEIGNSSAANLFVAKCLAERKAENVLTFIYEPFRSFYQGHNIYKKEHTINQVNV